MQHGVGLTLACLQAFRHLYVLATEPRCLAAVDVHTRQPVFAPVSVQLQEPQPAGGSAVFAMCTLHMHRSAASKKKKKTALDFFFGCCVGYAKIQRQGPQAGGKVAHVLLDMLAPAQQCMLDELLSGMHRWQLAL